MDDLRREDWERIIRSLGAGFLIRWDQHDPAALKEEVGPITRPRAEEPELLEAWFG
jgi:hypothetical protein